MPFYRKKKDKNISSSSLPEKDQILQIFHKINYLPLPVDLFAKLHNLGSLDQFNGRASQSTMDLLALFSATLAASAPDALAVLSQRRFVLGKKGRGKRKASKMSKEDSNCWEMNAKFKNMTYWKHDSLPSQHDAFLRSFHWLVVAEVLHQPVGAEDLFSASIELEKFRQ
ncbi:hypothetical protein UlMin_045886 [Ulmus minor]